MAERGRYGEGERRKAPGLVVGIIVGLGFAIVALLPLVGPKDPQKTS